MYEGFQNSVFIQRLDHLLCINQKVENSLSFNRFRSVNASPPPTHLRMWMTVNDVINDYFLYP